MEEMQTPITWEQFKIDFLNKYFPSNFKDKKEIEYLELKQETLTIGKYVATFEELARYSNNLRNQPDESWKSKRFNKRLRPKIRNQVVTQEIREYKTFFRKSKLAKQALVEMNTSNSTS
jgi:hypothetical protein